MDLSAYLQAKLAELSYDDPSAVEYIVGIILEESLEEEDKLEAIIGILDADPEDQEMRSKLEKVVEDACDFALGQELARRLALSDEATAPPPTTTKSNAPLTPEQEALRRKQLIQSFGYLEEDEPQPTRKGGKAVVETDGSVVMPDGKTMSKKARKKAEEGMDLLGQPNINKALVKGAELQRRNEDAAKSSAKKSKDKADLEKQKSDAIKKAADKTKKAVKQERRA